MKLYRMPFGIALSVLVLGGSAFAQTANQAQGSVVAPRVSSLTLSQALERALANNAELAVSRREVEAAQAARIQSGAWSNPELAFSAEDMQRKETRTTAVTLSQLIELGGKRGARVSVAERGIDVARADLAAKRAEVRAAVVAAFHDVLIAQERVRFAERSLEIARAAAEATGKRVTAGNISPVEQTRARVAEASVKVELAQARNEAMSARQRLSASWGETFPSFDQVVGAAELPALPPLVDLESRLAASPLLKVAEAEVQRRQAMVSVERARRVPDVTVSLGTQRSEELGRNQTLVGLSVPLPLFDRNRGNVLEAMRREDKARDELGAVRLRLATELLQARGQLERARTEAESLRDDVLPGARSAFEASVRGFELGKFSFLDVLDARRTLYQTESQYLRAVSDAYRAAADIDRLLGDAQSEYK